MATKNSRCGERSERSERSSPQRPVARTCHPGSVNHSPSTRMSQSPVGQFPLTRTVARDAMSDPVFARKGRGMTAVFVGIDVSKNGLDVFRTDHKELRHFENNSSGFELLSQWLAKTRCERILLEATGSYHTLLVAHLAAARQPVVVINPRQVRDFAKASGKLAKNDRIDARMLAEFGQKIETQLRPVPSDLEQKLQEILARRQQLIQMRTMELNRLQQAHVPEVKGCHQSLIDILSQRIDQADDEIDQLIQESDIWRHKIELLQSMPGVGPQTARVLVIEFGELGNCSRAQAAALIGLAPFDCDSGQFKGRRRIRGGRSLVRKTLYMTALTAMRFNPVIAGHYQHLKSQGKAFKVALVACMRKLIVILNAMLRTNTPWQLKTTEN